MKNSGMQISTLLVINNSLLICFYRDLVRTAHLKPANISASGKPARTRIWNNLALNKRSSHHDPPDYTETQRNKTSAQANSTHLASNQIPSGSSQFLTCWQQSDAPARLSLLYKMGPSGLSQIFSIDMPTALLGEIFEALLGFAPTVEGVATVVRLLDALTRVRRFSLVVHFLNTEEKAVCQHLINKLLASLVSREQDLAEIGISYPSF